MDYYQQDQIFPFVIRKESTPHIAKQIFLSLNQDAMGKCRLVSNAWKGFIDCHTPFWEKVPAHLYIRAAKEGRLDVCHLIIQHGQNKNPADDHSTPLHWAANEGHFEVCRLIIDNVQDKTQLIIGVRRPCTWPQAEDTLKFVALSLKMFKIRTQLKTMVILLCTWLQLKNTWKFVA